MRDVGESENEEVMWLAVLDRDVRYDGTFVYAVRSTGIFCRPSCPARRPRREQVLFYASSVEAHGAGYRPCKRCRPDETVSPAQWLVEQVRVYIDEHADEGVTLGELGQVVRRSPFHVQRAFKQATGLTPKQYVTQLRLARLKASLREGQNVVTAQYTAGYGSSSSLYASAPVQLGMTPATYRNGGQGEWLNYTVTDSPYGRLLVAYTARGVCMVCLGDTDQALVDQLRTEYPRAELAAAPVGDQPWLRAVTTYLEGNSQRIDVPLDVHGTVFQRQVWQALGQIPYGSTRTYRQIADQLGSPKAVRAVGQACAANPVALVVPCHRVIRADGGLGGYRWGVERKKRLLAQESGLSSE